MKKYTCPNHPESYAFAEGMNFKADKVSAKMYENKVIITCKTCKHVIYYFEDNRSSFDYDTVEGNMVEPPHILTEEQEKHFMKREKEIKEAEKKGEVYKVKNVEEMMKILDE